MAKGGYYNTDLCLEDFENVSCLMFNFFNFMHDCTKAQKNAMKICIAQGTTISPSLLVYNMMA